MKISELKGKYAGQNCYIIGRGPSLLNIERDMIGPGLVIVINEAIQNVCALDLPNDIYNQWRNGDVPPDTLDYLRDTDTLILCDNPVLGDPPSSTLFMGYPNRYTFECAHDLGKVPATMFSHAAAFEIAYQILGCRNFIMMGFDSFRGEDRTVLKDGFVPSELRPGDYAEQIQVMGRLIDAKPDVTVKWFFPDGDVSSVKGSSVTVITCTGDRPEAFALCRKWIEHQTVQSFQWIVVDDGKTKMKGIPDNCDYVRRAPKKNDPKHTLLLNLKEGLKRVKGDRVLFFEDDEYYAPGYIEAMCNRLWDYEVVGIGRSKYYHLRGGWSIDHNLNHASLAETGFRASFIDKVLSLCDGRDMFLDIRLWKILNGDIAPKCDAHDMTERERVTRDRRGMIFDDYEKCLYVGIKGMPGRPGIGTGGHKFGGYTVDADFSTLKKWIGEDVQYYEQYMRRR